MIAEPSQNGILISRIVGRGGIVEVMCEFQTIESEKRSILVIFGMLLINKALPSNL
jgi:hypothetical protein